LVAKKKNTEGAGNDTPGAGSGSEAPVAVAEPQPGAVASPAAPEPDDSAGDAGDAGDAGAKAPEPEPASYIIVPDADFSFGWNGVLVQLHKGASAIVEPAQLRALEAMGAPFTRRT
jgi:hypothetical protein